MENEVRDNILIVLKEVKQILCSNNVIVSELKRLSNSLLEDISLMHDSDSISISVLTHSLYKILSKDSRLDTSSLCEHIGEAINSIDDETVFRIKIKKLFDHIKKYDKDLGVTILQTIKHAQVKKGLKIYEHGLSIGKASEIMGVSRWDILDYVGNFKIDDADSFGRVDAKARINFARGLFR
ncbi:MAG: hypothetical protein ACMXYG_00990 [Candidatus Woesearchaeota archaeon]